MADIFAEFDAEAKKFYDTLGAESTPSAEQRAAEEKRQEEQRLAGEAFTSLSPLRRGMAGARHVVGSMPIVRHAPYVRDFVNPQEGTDAATDLAQYRTGMPASRRIGTVIGGAAPAAVMGGLAPGVMSRLSGAVPVNAGIAGGDAYLNDENPALSATIAGLLTVPGAAMSRAVTPMSSARSTAAREAFEASKRRAAESATDESVAALNQAMMAHLGTRSPTTPPSTPDIKSPFGPAQQSIGPGRRGSGGVATTPTPPPAPTPPTAPRMTTAEADALMQSAVGRAQSAGESLSRASTPTMEIPTLGSGRNRLARAVENFANSAVWGALGGGGAHYAGINPLLGIGLGALAPRAGQLAQDAANAGIRTINRTLLGPHSPRAVRRATFGYGTNQVLSDEMRALINALGPSALQAEGGNLLETTSPTLLRLMGGQ